MMTNATVADSLKRPPFDLLNGASLILDFDGTLVEMAAAPDAVEVGEDLRRLLLRLKDALGGRVAILTGRPLEQIDRLIHPLELPVAGSHGLEARHANGEQIAAERPEALDSAVLRLRQLTEENPGVLIEEKPLGVAIHYRQAPEAEEQCRVAAEATAELTGLEIQPGKMVFELKPPEGNKGLGLKALMAAPPFAGTMPVYLGDDWTDEPGFAVAMQLGGAGIYVGAPRLTAAIYRLNDVEDALVWLERSLGALA